MERLRTVEALLRRAEAALLALLLSVMIGLSFWQVVLRQIWGTGLLWADTLLRHLVLWVGFLGGALAAADGKHFAWEPASQKGGRAGAVMKIVAHAAAAAVCAALVKASWDFLSEERAAGDILFMLRATGIPAWAFSSIIPAGFLLIGVHMAARAIEAAAALRHPGAQPPQA